MLDLATQVRKLELSGKKIIDLSLGQPDVPAPPHIVEAFRRSASRGSPSYGLSAGSSELRSLIASECTKDSRVRTDPAEVIVTSGSKHAIFVTLLALLDPGDEVLVPEPYFPPYAEISALAGAELKTVPVTWSNEEVGLDVDGLLRAVSPQTKAILLNYPNNPAGWTLDEADVKQIARFCAETGVYLVSDEIYDKIIFDDRVHHPAWTFSRDTKYVIRIGSFSKTYSMIPYRLGYLVAKQEVAREILKVVRATITMVSPYAQDAGCAALNGPQDFVISRRRKYQERRDRCLQILKENGIVIPTPEGAFYLFVRMPTSTDGLDFAKRLLERDHVAVLPGGIFGEMWRNFVRISIATEDSSLTEGMTKFVKRYREN